jgi:8-oxo-dGTP diphosphatase
VSPELCVGAVCLLDHSLLLIQRGTDPDKGLWSLPGGRVEVGEIMAEAVVREFREEVGLDAVCGSLIGWVERITDDYHFAIFDFEVTLFTERGVSPTPTAGDDADAAEFVPLYEVTDRQLVPGLIEFLSDHNIISTIV